MAILKADKQTASAGHHNVILAPFVTEKSSLVADGGRKVVFEVSRTATKTDIRAAVERVFNVKVEGVRTVNMMGKPKGSARSTGRRSAYKKAYITLEEGQKINLVDGL